MEMPTGSGGEARLVATCFLCEVEDEHVTVGCIGAGCVSMCHPKCAALEDGGVGWICAECDVDVHAQNSTLIRAEKLTSLTAGDNYQSYSGGDQMRIGTNDVDEASKEAQDLQTELRLLEEEDQLLQLRQQLLHRRKALMGKLPRERLSETGHAEKMPGASSTRYQNAGTDTIGEVAVVEGNGSTQRAHAGPPWLFFTSGEDNSAARVTKPVGRPSYEQLTARKTSVAELVKFSGRPEDWPLFIATYEQTTELCGFTDAENLMRLRHALEGPAKNAVQSLMLHADCVPQIIATLRMRFGRPEIIIDLLVTRIRQFPQVRENKLEMLVDFSVEVQNVCATMKASKLDQYLNNPALTQELVSKLPSMVQTFWGMHKASLTVCTLAEFSTWLSQMAEGASHVIVPSSSSRTERRGTVHTHTVRQGCRLCTRNCRTLQECPAFLEMTTRDRWNATRRCGLCWRCFQSHKVERCGVPNPCGIDGCLERHHPLLHRGSTAPVQARCHAHRQEGVEMLFRVLTLYGNGRQVNTYAFIDDGSSLTLIDAPLLEDLGVKGQPQPLCMQWTAGMHRYEDSSVRLDLRISGIGQTKQYDLRDVHSVQSLDLPSQSLDITHLKAQHTHLRHLPLSGYDSAQPRLLIGLNNCKLGRVLRTKEGTTEEPIAEKTRLGWTIKGRSSNSVGDDITPNYHVFHICACEADENKEILRLLEQCMWSDGGPRPEMNSKSVSNDDQLAIQQLEKNTRRINGRFETGLLWRYKDDKLPDSLPTALKRARCLYQKLTREPELAKGIRRQLDEYVMKGYARPVTSEEAEEKPYWYLPIFPVLNVNKPGKLRIVWDATAKTEGISLNTMLLKGPDQLAQLVPILHRFREKRIAIGDDIAEMFYQVRIHTEDQRYQRFVFIDPNTQRRENYAMQVMTFGAGCSPSCAQYVKNRNAESFKKEYPRAVKCILENHYVDDMLDSVDTEEEAISLARQVHYIHLQGGFLIRNWVSNSREVLSALGEGAPTLVRLDEATDGQTEKVLRMWWDTKEDLIRYRVSPRYRHKELLQGRQRPNDENGFAAEAGIHCSLLGSKTKVAPLRPTSIPRLELMGAVLGARLAQTLELSLGAKLSTRTFWTDSRTVLSWLRSDQRKYKQFVAFRVIEILDGTSVKDWRWVPSSENVADDATKWNKGPDFNRESRWLNGPRFLWQERQFWPLTEAEEGDESGMELKAQFIGVCDGFTDVSRASLIDSERFSIWTRLLWSTARTVWCMRRWKAKALQRSDIENQPSQEDTRVAESLLWSYAQAEYYQTEIRLILQGKPLKKNNLLYKLGPYMDSDGVLKLDERAKMIKGSDRVVLPCSSHITQLIIKEFHRRFLHANHETVVNELRQRFWIPKLRSTLARIRRSCQQCKNRQAAPKPPRMAELPYPRVAAFHRPFSYTGVDYFGPLMVRVRRSSEKRYGVLFTCLSTRAIHLEVAYSLTTDSCILAVRSFMARRGCPVELWSDNGTNFQGACTELRRAFEDMDKDLLSREFTGPQMTWKFIPPASPHMGGAWERLVRSVKTALESILLDKRPSDELLRAALMEAEAIVNSRPLTYIPLEDENEESLTPNHFLLGSSTGRGPTMEPLPEGVQLKKSWRESQQLADSFWRRWLQEYLPVITRRTKWCEKAKPLVEGDIVYVCDPGQPRSQWPKGRILKVNLSSDGQVRSAAVRTQSGVYTRPATKLAVLSIESSLVDPWRNIQVGSVTIDSKTAPAASGNAEVAEPIV
nr:uncharacterized protein LOC122322057 [Drosophila bipectinata]